MVNLTGRSVDCRDTAANRRAIIDSRVDSVRAIGNAINQCSEPTPAWVQAGSLAIYGNPGKLICEGDAPSGKGFRQMWARGGGQGHGFSSPFHCAVIRKV